MKRWDIYSKERLLNRHRNYNDNIKINIKSGSSFEHTLFRFLSIYSTSLRFYSKPLKYYDKKITIRMSKYLNNKKNYINNSFKSNDKLFDAFKQLFDTNIKFLNSKIYIEQINYANRLIYFITKIKKLLKIVSFSIPLEANDYNKIIVCSSFRRLQDKAQVYSLEESDYPRTRLTHSIEVASLSRKIFYLLKSYSNNFYKNFEKVLESACIIHDLGNPPFGHYGEKVIRSYYKNNWDSLLVAINKKFNEFGVVNINKIIGKQDRLYLDFVLFDGNAQSLRIMSKLQEYKGHSHLEVSFSILGAIIKYPFDSLQAKAHQKEKIGYFYSEEDVIEKMRAVNTYIDNYRNPFSMLVEASDDISYIISDLDDAIKKGIITYEIFNKEIINYDNKQNNEVLLKKFIKDFNKYYKKNMLDKNDAFYYTMKSLLIDLKEETIKEVAHNFWDNHNLIFNKGIDFFGKDKKELLDFPNAKYGQLLLLLRKKLINKYVFCNHDVLINELKGEKILSYLLNVFTKAILMLKINKNDTVDMILENNKDLEKECKLFSLVSKNYFDVFIKEYSNVKTEKERVYYKLRLVVDYVSGMTDTYSNDLYIKLNY